MTADMEVKKGDILVSGKAEILNDDGEVVEYIYPGADADIIAEVNFYYEDEINISYQDKIKTGRAKKDYGIRFFDYHLKNPFFRQDYEQFDLTEHASQLHFTDNFYLPVYFGEITTSELQEKTVMLTKEQVKQLALTHFSQFLSELEENGVRIVDKNVMIEQIDKNYHIYGQVKGCEKITTLVPTEMKREEPVNESE